MSEPWNWRESVTNNVTNVTRPSARQVVSHGLEIAVNLTCYTAVASFVYMSMLRREYRESQKL